MNTTQELDLKEIYKIGQVEISHYRKGNLYYTLIMGKDGHVNRFYQFPIPISDTGDATFMKRDKASMFFRYIKKAIEDGSLKEVDGK